MCGSVGCSLNSSSFCGCHSGTYVLPASREMTCMPSSPRKTMAWSFLTMLVMAVSAAPPTWSVNLRACRCLSASIWSAHVLPPSMLRYSVCKQMWQGTYPAATGQGERTCGVLSGPHNVVDVTVELLLRDGDVVEWCTTFTPCGSPAVVVALVEGRLGASGSSHRREREVSGRNF